MAVDDAKEFGVLGLAIVQVLRQIAIMGMGGSSFPTQVSGRRQDPADSTWVVPILDSRLRARLKDPMPTKPAKNPRTEHRPMPEDPHELAQAMFRHGDKKMKEKREAEKPDLSRPVVLSPEGKPVKST